MNFWRPPNWGAVWHLVVYGFMAALLTMGLAILTSMFWAVYFNEPPITITSLDPPNLGALCPGDEIYVHNKMKIKDRIIVFYYLTTMDVTGSYNMFGTQKAFTDLLHPRASEFEQWFTWTVPDLEPGRYRRVMGARDITRNQKTVFVEATYEIAEGCK